MMNKIFLVILALLTYGVEAQTSLDAYLQSVIANNKTIKANGLYADWQKEQAKIGNTPDNPEIAYGYFPGNSDAIGTKKVFELSQAFDFPTTYIHNSKIAKQSSTLADELNRLQSTLVLTEAWESWVKAVYYNKKGSILKQREAEALKMLDNYLKKQKNGDATQLEVNKAKLFLIDVQNDVRLHFGHLIQNNEALNQLNGGEAYLINDTSFTPVLIEPWDSLLNKLNRMHPEIIISEQSKVLAENNLKLRKSAWLPSFRVGYESEDIMGDVYRGVRGGVSIPLWQEKNTINANKVNIEYAQQLISDTQLKLALAYKQKYISATVLQNNLRQFSTELIEMNNTYLLQRSLELGQISAIEYFIELNYFYQISDELLELELEFQMQVAKLYGFTL